MDKNTHKWNSKQPVKKGCLVVIPNHFLCKDLVHHPIETTIKKWLFGYTQRFELVGFLCNCVWFTLGNYTEGMSTFVFAICSRDYFNRKYIFQPLIFRGHSFVFRGVTATQERHFGCISTAYNCCIFCREMFLKRVWRSVWRTWAI